VIEKARKGPYWREGEKRVVCVAVVTGKDVLYGGVYDITVGNEVISPR